MVDVSEEYVPIQESRKVRIIKFKYLNARYRIERDSKAPQEL